MFVTALASTSPRDGLGSVFCVGGGVLPKHREVVVPIIFRTEVPLSDNIDLGAGGGVHLEFFPSDVFTADFFAADSSQYTYDQYTQRVGWMRSAATVELGCVFGLSDGSGLHVGVQIQRALGQWFRAESYGRLDDEILHVKTYLSGHHWGLDVRWILP
jgi:hypothetical protein